jgi:hypothetical protein
MLNPYTTPTMAGTIHAFNQLSYPGTASVVSGFHTVVNIVRNVSILRLLAHIAHALVARITIGLNGISSSDVLVGLPSEQMIEMACSHVEALHGTWPCNPQRFIRV